MSNLVNLIYGSSAVGDMNETELVAILTKARENNHRLNVTGMLLYKGGNFLQVLEGERETVEALFEVIRKDPRHHLIQHYSTRSVPERNFGEWEMGFTDLDNNEPTLLPGYTHFLTEPLNSERFKDQSYAATFLRVFKESIR